MKGGPVNTRSILAILVATFILIGIAPTAPAQTIVLKMGHGHSQQHPDHLGYLKFKELLEKSSSGRLKVEIYPNSQLGSEEEMAQQVKLGTLTGLVAARYEDMSPKLYATSLPFLFRDYDHAEKALKSSIGKELAGNTEANDMKMLAWTHSGFRQITNNARPIRKPEDLKGLKIRTPPLESVLKSMEAFGATPTPIPFGEVYTALKTGVVDGQENPYVNIFTGKFFEVQKFLSEVNYIYISSPLVVNLKFWKGLSPADQKLVETAAVESADLINSLVRSEDLKAKDAMAKAGLKINALTPEEHAAFVAKAAPVYEYFIKKGLATQAGIEAIQKVK
jgi:tripartite ATP-independent transporter DctP family solute receptor